MQRITSQRTGPRLVVPLAPAGDRGCYAERWGRYMHRAILAILVVVTLTGCAASLRDVNPISLRENTASNQDVLHILGFPMGTARLTAFR